MVEQIYNIFLFFNDNEVCSEVGYTTHTHNGADKEALIFLQERVETDINSCQRVSLSRPFTKSEYDAHCRHGNELSLYDEVFLHANAGASPLFVSTPVRNGKAHFNYSAVHGNIIINNTFKKIGAPLTMIDWLQKYSSANGIDLTQLIHDDYFLAIKLTFNAGLYVSAMKLLLCCIDSLAYIEYGDDRGAFLKWMDEYCDLAPLGITAAELWELRNSLLHMTNLNSHKVRKNKVRRISFLVGSAQEVPHDAGSIYYFDFYALIQAFSQAQAQWLESYNSNPDKFAKFVERYDETVSDSRVAVVHLPART